MNTTSRYLIILFISFNYCVEQNANEIISRAIENFKDKNCTFDLSIIKKQKSKPNKKKKYNINIFHPENDSIFRYVRIDTIEPKPTGVFPPTSLVLAIVAVLPPVAVNAPPAVNTAPADIYCTHIVIESSPEAKVAWITLPTTVVPVSANSVPINSATVSLLACTADNLT